MHHGSGGIGVDRFRHAAVGRFDPCGRALVHHGHAARVVPAGLDHHVSIAEGEQFGMGQGQHRAGIVQRTAPLHAEVDRVVGRGEMVDEIGYKFGPFATAFSHVVFVLGAPQELMGDVQPAHHDRRATLEHHGRSLGVGVDVELGSRGAVAERGAAAHERDAGDAINQRGVGSKGEGDVGEWPGRYQPRTRMFTGCRQQVTNGIGPVDRASERWQGWSRQAALTVNVSSEHRRLQEWSRRAGMDRYVEVEKLGGDERVLGGVGER